jgi:hypothetical protein
MRQSLADLRHPEWQILSTYVRLQDGPRRVDRAFRLLLGPTRSPEAPPPTEGSSDHACSHLRSCLDRPPGTRSDD